MIVFLLCAFCGRWLAALSPELYFAALTRRVSTFRSQGQARSTPWRLPPAPVAGRHKPRAGQAPPSSQKRGSLPRQTSDARGPGPAARGSPRAWNSRGPALLPPLLQGLFPWRPVRFIFKYASPRPDQTLTPKPRDRTTERLRPQGEAEGGGRRACVLELLKRRRHSRNSAAARQRRVAPRSRSGKGETRPVWRETGCAADRLCGPGPVAWWPLWASLVTGARI